MAFCSLQTIEMHEDSMEYYITGLVITPLFLMCGSTFSLVPHVTERINLRWEGKPLWTPFTHMSNSYRKAAVSFCRRKHAKFTLCFLSFCLQLLLGVFWLPFLCWYRNKSSTSACKILHVNLDTVKTGLDGFGLEKCWPHKKKMYFFYVLWKGFTLLSFLFFLRR